VVETLKEGFARTHENGMLLKKKRKFEGATHILEWNPIERPSKVPRVKIPGFKGWCSFEIQGKASVEALRPSIQLEPVDHHPYFQVKKVREFSEVYRIRKSEKTQRRSTVFSTFRGRRQQEIQIRRGISASSPPRQSVCISPMI